MWFTEYGMQLNMVASHICNIDKRYKILATFMSNTISIVFRSGDLSASTEFQASIFSFVKVITPNSKTYTNR